MKIVGVKTAKHLGFVLFVSFHLSAGAQIYSSNIVGYINQVLFAGDNLIANQLGNSDNSLSAIFQLGVPEGSTFTEWDSTLRQYLPVSVYDLNTGWSINYTLSYGQGGLFHAPFAFTNTFVGDVWPGMSLDGPFDPPLVSNDGTLLLSCYVPIAPATFYDVVGRNPQNGESVDIWNARSQTSTVTTYQNGGWNNGEPLLNIGESAFYNLGTFSVPEPAVFTLAGAGFFILATFCRPQRRG